MCAEPRKAALGIDGQCRFVVLYEGREAESGQLQMRQQTKNRFCATLLSNTSWAGESKQSDLWQDFYKAI